MKTVLLAIALSLISVAPAQDEFPPGRKDVLLAIGHLPKEAKFWSASMQARRSAARVLELTGLLRPIDRIVRAASGADEALLTKILKHRKDIEFTLHYIPRGFTDTLCPEAAELHAQLRRAWVAIPKLLEAKSMANFPDIPETHEWFERLTLLIRSGLISEVPGLWRGPRPTSRLYFAVATREACENLPGVASAPVKAANESRSLDSGMLADALTALRLMIDKFQVELRILGSDPAQMRSSIDHAFAVGFKDVPAIHWAASAVKALHARGLLLGYPEKVAEYLGADAAETREPKH